MKLNIKIIQKILKLQQNTLTSNMTSTLPAARLINMWVRWA